MTLTTPAQQLLAEGLTIQPDDPCLADVRRLIERLDDYLGTLYPPESNHLLSPEALRAAGIVFLTARVGGVAVGCGALVEQQDYGEIKRMYVAPEHRGRGIAAALLARLEACAAERGIGLVRLETGVAQPEAIRLFHRAGYRACSRFGDYPDDPLSVFLEKRLADGGASASPG